MTEDSSATLLIRVIPRSDIAIVAGEKSRDKQVRIAGLTRDQLAQRLAALER